MTRNDAQTHLELIKAFAAGKTIQICYNGIEWYDILEPDFYCSRVYRIKPEPTWRPWKPEEVPVGAQVRAHGPSNTRRLIIEASRATCLCGDVLIEYEELFNHHEHSLDNGKTWQPCGILE